ncbi:hypothetical protein CLV49_0742 [Labedella gwakjiensis]|uniref:DUF3618 domain-containing protein n=1 Tax=Labedella gwakjiensis TaxID=390269 RepID=A0A2P8GT36_9MICO|nr:hypothetical protein [Labedella gwakjiensis]PSL37136.1 hypothetical protein CLV49_0742 [Labedella gwakjiensis]RUQ81962.1 hypothetical protein ELQ93_16885 [Labedella gwakjiensis]
MTDSSAPASGPGPGTSIPLLNLEMERTRLEFRDTVREIEDRLDVLGRYRRWRGRASGADRAFPVALVAGVVIVGIAAVGVIREVRARR